MYLLSICTCSYMHNNHVWSMSYQVLNQLWMHGGEVTGQCVCVCTLLCMWNIRFPHVTDVPAVCEELQLIMLVYKIVKNYGDTQSMFGQ